MEKPIKKIVSVCTLKDAKTWIRSAGEIRKQVAAEQYELVVPSRQVDVFKALTPAGWTIVDEQLASTDFSLEYVSARMPAANRGRAGWYFQQLLKIQSFLNHSGPDDDILLIWDADTIPLRRLQYESNGKLAYFVGGEHHQPYFDAIQRLLGVGKAVDFSFIAQCFPARAGWVREFVRHVERQHGKRWFDAVLDATDLSQASGFSEYETLGTFFVNKYRDAMAVNTARWERFGNKLAPMENVLDLPPSNDLPAFVAYESWSEQPAAGKKVAVPRPVSEDDFLKTFFDGLNVPRAVVQVGANDGQMCDPLAPYLLSSRCDDVLAVLMEPLDYYFAKLSKLHGKRANTVLVKAGASAAAAVRDFYYVDPEVASEMNGDGPANDWAHGQGSFFRDSILYWIEQNAFRGAAYRANIERYKRSVLRTDINCMPLKNLAVSSQRLKLLVIDVQGAELEVLLGVDWFSPPDFILYEQDMEQVGIIRELLVGFGFDYLCGSANVLFYNRSTVDIVAR